MGSSSSKFRKHIQSGDEYAAIHLYSSSSDLRKALDPNLSYGDSYSHDTPMHMVARHAMKSLLRFVCLLLTFLTTIKLYICVHIQCLQVKGLVFTFRHLSVSLQFSVITLIK